MPSTPIGAWRLEATINGNTVSRTFVVGALSVPDAPTIGTTSASSCSLSVGFTPPAFNGGLAIDNYRATCTGGKTAFASSTPIPVSGLTNGATYSCTVAAHNSMGWSAESAATAGVVVRGPIAPPASPTISGVQLRPGGAEFALLPPDPEGWPIVAYTITCTAPGQATASGSSTTTTVSLGGLKKDVPYNCSATASNATYTSSPSAPTTVTPTRNPDITPVLMLLLD